MSESQDHEHRNKKGYKGDTHCPEKIKSSRGYGIDKIACDIHKD
jgi:hypothetical protein